MEEQNRQRQEVTNFARFYRVLGRMACSDRDELKKSLVTQYSEGRTDSLRQLTRREYEAMCADLEHRDERLHHYDLVRQTLRRYRSQALHLMQRLGVDTADWQRVDDFCLTPRICGKAFRELTADELNRLCTKLRAIERKGGLSFRDKVTFRDKGLGMRDKVPAGDKAVCLLAVPADKIVN